MFEEHAGTVGAGSCTGDEVGVGLTVDCADVVGLALAWVEVVDEGVLVLPEGCPVGLD